MLTNDQIELYKNCLFLKEQALITYGKEIKANYDVIKDKKILEKVREFIKSTSGIGSDEYLDNQMEIVTSYDYLADLHVSQTGEDGIDTLQGNNFKTLDNKKMEYLLESEDIVDDFKKFMSLEFDRIYEKYKSGHYKSFKTKSMTGLGTVEKMNYPKEISQLVNSITLSIDRLTDMGVERSEINNYLTRSLVIDSDDPDEIRKLIKLRVDYNKSMTMIFEEMLRTNYKVLGVSTKQIESLIAGLNSGDQSNEEKTMSAIRQIVKKKKHKFLFKKEGLIDFSPLGGGIILGPAKFEGLPEAIESPERYLQTAFRWDVTIISHGKEEYEDGDDNFETYWYIQPTSFNGTEYTRLNELLKALIRSGHKKIKVNSCNPGHKDLDPEILNKTGVRIHFAKNSVVRESSDFSIDPVMANLEEAENSLINLAEDYDIDYWDNKLLKESYLEIEDSSYVLNESKLWDTIKELARKFVKAIIFIWKKIVEFFKFIWQKIKEFIMKRINAYKDRKAKKKIKSSFIVVNSTAVLRDIETDNIKDLSNAITTSCSTISNSIRQNNQTQNHMVKMYSDKLEKIIKEKEQ